MRRFTLPLGFVCGLLAVGAVALVLTAPAPVASQARPAGAPAELKVGFVDFLSGPAVLFGAS